ncbi:MAG: LysE family translocator [Pseudomonadota bacterium]
MQTGSELHLIGLVGPALLALGAAAISPGPNAFAAISTALGSGRAKGLMVAVGIGCGGLVWAMLSAFGLARLLDVLPQTVTVLAAAGALYLAYLAYKGFRSAIGGAAPSLGAKSAESFQSAFLRGLLVTLTNPKAGLMWLSLMGFVAVSSNTSAPIIAFGVAGALLVFFIYGTMALVFSNAAVRAGYEKYHRVADGAFGFAFAALALLLVQRFLV